MRTLKGVLMVVLFAAGCSKASTDTTTTTSVDCSTVTYSTTIKSIVNSKCTGSGCHGSGSSRGDFTVYANLYSTYKSGDLRREVITNKTMPQNSSLTSEQLRQMECWINGGALQN